ncbi:dihydrodipicolinate synthase family protein [Membranicola marinus]|uniref:Dihydrodipicolinate synthase family protein n=1 Tax=Membranihabitans marinus TaxID=1227546 RepID=A0A953HMG0_9BACT|nr:dihydrodipicolinate synthase family protein [Membranihabitans marinus]MBY5958674.1 dihydrodipicolinate synthase family protein [Membranihabitans marinus]
MLKDDIRTLLHEGTVIPAHPLALTADRKLDEARQRLLTRYYIESGAGGVAVAVHSTQFEIRNDDVGLLEPVLRLAVEEIDKAQLNRPFAKVAGIVGPTDQAVQEAELAKNLGYDLGLLSMGGLNDYSEDELIHRAKKVGEIIPIFGFYLQPAVGGQVLSYEFWKKFAEIPAVQAIKMAPFDRYQTLDVVRAVCNSSRWEEIALYTGNDDNIIADLLTTYAMPVNGEIRKKKIVGGLLGHWAVWTQKAVELLEEIKEIRAAKAGIPEEMLTRNIDVTDANAVLFDVAHDFHGCIPGIHEVLRRQGLLEGTWCLNPDENLSPGQSEELDRIYRDYPDLNDDDFVRQFLENQEAG